MGTKRRRLRAPRTPTRMNPGQPLTHPTGTHTIRLKDIPLAQRLAALTTASAQAKDEEEAIKMLHLALEPGDCSARICA